jgi:hypothetical protein
VNNQSLILFSDNYQSRPDKIAVYIRSIFQGFHQTMRSFVIGRFQLRLQYLFALFKQSHAFLKLSLKSISPFIAASVMALLVPHAAKSANSSITSGLNQRRVHIKTNQTSVSSKHIVFLKRYPHP